MTEAWIIVRKERHIDDKYWVCLSKDDAINLALEITTYWQKQYELSSDDINNTLYEGLVFSAIAEDAFRVFVQPQKILLAGESTEQSNY